MERLKKLIRKKLPKNVFVRNASILVGGTLVAQVLLILIAPILTRLYSPDDFGLLAVYVSMLAITLLLSSLRYDIAIPLPKEDTEASNLVVLSLILVGINSFLVSILVLLLSDSIAEMLSLPMLTNYLWLLPIGILLGGIYNIFNQWSVRTKHFRLIASTKIKQALAVLAIQLFAFKLGGLALMLGQIAGHAVGVTNLARPDFSKVSWTGIRKVAIRYQRFPIYSTPAGLARVLGVELPLLVLAAAFSPAAAGLYALTSRVMGVPAAILGGAISQVFVSNAANAYRNDSLAPLVRGLYTQMSQIGLPIALLIMMLGPELFGIIFGETWRQSGEFARWMALWLYLVFVSSPITSITSVMERQKQGLVFHLLLLMFRIIALYIGIRTDDLMITIIILAVVNTIWRLVFLLWLYVISGNSINSFISDSVVALTKALICVAPVAVALVVYSAIWFYALIVSLILISILYWQLLKRAY
jgi:O-antigen/teichoic acid export membrane protein